MNKIITGIMAKKAEQIAKAADEEVTVSKKVLTLELAVAVLSGFVLGMLLSPRKTCTYKIASGNHINADDNDDDEYDDDDEDEEDLRGGKTGRFIKL